MSKLTVVWLIALWVLGIIFAGYAEAEAVFAQRPAAVTVVAPISVSSSLRSGTDSFPMVPDTIIFSPRADSDLRLCWARLTDYQRQRHSIARIRYSGMPPGTDHGCKFAEPEQPKLAIPASSSGSLSSTSPPGLILRL